MEDQADVNGPVTMSPNLKLVIMGGALAILFVIIFNFMGAKPAFQPNQPVESSVSPTTVVSSPPTSSVISPSSMDATVSDRVMAVSSPDNPVVQIKTDVGNLTIELYPDHAPVAVNKFMELINSNYYAKGTVLESKSGIGFVIAKVKDEVEDFGKMKDEANNLRSERGSVAIVKSAVSSAYLNNIFIGYTHQSELQDMYIIFGQVVDGVDAVEKQSYGRVGQVTSTVLDEAQSAIGW